MGDWEQRNLIAELTLGREIARQLQIHLNMPSSSRETSEMLVQKILACYEKALSIVNFSGPLGQPGAAIPMSESPPFLTESPRSEDDSADRDFKEQDPKDGSRKKKSMPRWTEQVRVGPGIGLEGPLDDGFSWRKYGQKDILGARYPRGYYRCTHRNVQGCLATKHVQRSDADPTIFEITYRGRHTCSQANSHLLPTNSQPLANIQEQPINNNSTLDHPPQHTSAAQRTDTNYQLQPRQQQQQQQQLLNFGTGLKVITQHLDSRGQSFPSFHFAASTSGAVPGSHAALFSPSMTDNKFMENFSTPSASGTNYVSVSPSGMHVHSFGGNQSFQNSELNGIISAATSTSTNSPSPVVDPAFPFGNIESDPNFTFDSPGFLD